jgi:hypothetical protein
MKHLIALSLLAASTAFAGGSSQPKAPGPEPVGFIKLEDAPRMVMFDSKRNWYTADGVLLVCPFDAEADYGQDCTRGKAYAWIPATSYTIPGHTMVGYQHVYAGSGGNRQLHLYFRPVSTVKAEAAPPALNFTGPITITADKIVVQRRLRR